MALLDVTNVTLQYRTADRVVTATRGISFSVERSDRFVILGPSGCGKSTILKAVAGFVAPIDGRIRLGGSQVTKPGPDRIVVFQEFDQLLPWKTVIQNITFALTASRRVAAVEADSRARHYLRSEEHTSELQSRLHLVCRLLLEKKKNKYIELKGEK